MCVGVCACVCTWVRQTWNINVWRTHSLWPHSLLILLWLHVCMCLCCILYIHSPHNREQVSRENGHKLFLICIMPSTTLRPLPSHPEQSPLRHCCFGLYRPLGWMTGYRSDCPSTITSAEHAIQATATITHSAWYTRTIIKLWVWPHKVHISPLFPKYSTVVPLNYGGREWIDGFKCHLWYHLSMLINLVLYVVYTISTTHFQLSQNNDFPWISHFSQTF